MFPSSLQHSLVTIEEATVTDYTYHPANHVADSCFSHRVIPVWNILPRCVNCTTSLSNY